jgi:hypothetical protein
MSVGSTTRRPVQVSGFAFNRMLTPPHCLYPLRVPRTSALPSASFRSPVTRGTLAVQLALPLVGCAKDSHLQVSAPCQAHDRRRCRSGVQLGLRPSSRTPGPLPAGNRHTPMRIGTKKAGSKPAFFVPLVRPERFELPASWFVVAMVN